MQLGALESALVALWEQAFFCYVNFDSAMSKHEVAANGVPPALDFDAAGWDGTLDGRMFIIRHDDILIGVWIRLQKGVIWGWNADPWMLGLVVASDAVHLHCRIADGADGLKLLPCPVSVTHALHPSFVCHGADGGG